MSTRAGYARTLHCQFRPVRRRTLRDTVRDAAPLPPCFHTRFTLSQTTEAHFTEVASIEDEPEAVEVGRGVVKTRFNQECGAPLFQYLDVRM